MTSITPPPKVLIINGPNLNLLGRREPDVYGSTPLDQINARMLDLGSTLGLAVECFQSNHEGAIVDKIQEAVDTCQGLIINPAAFTHTSVAIRDAILMLDMPVVEIHLSNIHRRETFRKTSMLADVVTGQILGLGAEGYRLALEAVAAMLKG